MIKLKSLVYTNHKFEFKNQKMINNVEFISLKYIFLKAHCLSVFKNTLYLQNSLNFVRKYLY